MDPLSLLRERVMSHQPIEVDPNTEEFILGSYRFHKTTETNFRSKKGQGPPYTIEAVWFFLENSERVFREYLAECMRQHRPLVSLVDKKELLDYITGKTTTCKNLSTATDSLLPSADPPSTIPASLPSSAPIPSTSSTASADDNDRPSKRQKSEHLSAGASSALDGASAAPRDLLLDDALLESKSTFAARLDKAAVTSKPTLGVPSAAVPAGIGALLSADKIKELQMKRLAQKRGKVKENEIGSSSLMDLSFVEADAAVTRDIVKREKLVTDRTRCLQGKKTFRFIVDTTQAVLRREEREQKAILQQQHDKVAKVNTRYDRYNQVGSNPEVQKSGGFKIDTRGSTFTDGRPSSGTSAGASGTSGASSSGRRQSSSRHPLGTQAPTRAGDNAPVAPPRPIIVVPSALTSVLTLYNVKDFLENRSYVPTMEKKKSGVRKTSSVEFSKTLTLPSGVGGDDSIQDIKFQVVDNASKLQRDWHRVSVVVVQGAEWQFKGWKWPQPVDLFAHVLGIYLCYEGDIVPESVKAWNVKVVTISREKRYLDDQVCMQLWKLIEADLRRKQLSKMASSA
eukprot:TRINITY_DN3965_c1_g1_i1.p1 TRINITY_DN3965_c1_g1~~TRINITY_DN3965_c1_g1_i1.p1  ORF type:complete len:568 (+),score=139.25 TRINITY_DN3965_c1_g1_i1:539-2242(+)